MIRSVPPTPLPSAPVAGRARKCAGGDVAGPILATHAASHAPLEAGHPREAAGGADPAALDRFVSLVGREAWQQRIDSIIRAQSVPGGISHCGRDAIRRHAIEITIQRQRRADAPGASPAEQRIARLAAEAVRLHGALEGAARTRFERRLDRAMLDGQSLTPLFHLLRTARLHRSRGFEVEFAGLVEEAPFDLRLRRAGSQAEVVCDVVSAEQGRDVHRGAWFRLADMVKPELRDWVDVNPGRYMLKMTLLRCLRVGEPGPCALAGLQDRIRSMLADRRRSHSDDNATIRLEPLSLASRQASELGIADGLRAQFGPGAHIAVTVAGGGVFAMAAHAGRADDVPAAIRRRMSEIAPARLSGTRPGILAMYVDDTPPDEWTRLGGDMLLEAEARQFLTTQGARHVVSVACTSRHELFAPDRDDREYRFRNPRHAASKDPELAASILSTE